MTKEKNENKENIDDTLDVEFVDSDEEGNPLPKKDTDKKLREKLKECQKERDEYLTGWQRAKADYINLQKELENTRLRSGILEKEKVILGILPVFDSFRMAFQNKEAWGKVDPSWRQGIEYVFQQFNSSLEELGVKKVEDVNVPFDPKVHQPINTVPTDDNNLDEKIAKVVQVGFVIGDRVVRPARVEVYKHDK